MNFTRVKSNIQYITNAASNPPLTVVQPLVGLSPRSWNATLYYEHGRAKARVSGAYRAGYLSTVPGGNGNDVRGKFSTFNLDASASFEITEQLSASIEGINLTDQFDDRWISSQRKSPATSG